MRWLKKAWVPLAYTGITIVMTYPAVLHLHDLVLSGGEDAWVFWWNNWWVKRALVTGQSVYMTRDLFFPQGADLTYHSFSWLNTALWLVLEPILGNTAAYNLTVLWVFPLAGWGMEWLVHELTGSRSGSFIAGLIYAFVPYRIGQYNHASLMGTQWIPFYTLFLLRTIRIGQWRQLILSSLFLVLTALVGWNLFLYNLIWAAWIAVYAWVRKVGSPRRIVGALVGTTLIAVIALSPLLVPMFTRVGSEDTLTDIVNQDEMQTDLLAYAIPNKMHPLWGEVVQPIYERMGGYVSRVVFLGYTVMALLGYTLVRKNVRQQVGLWWVGIALWWLMALGPYLKLLGRIYYDIPLPYWPLSRLYVFEVLKIPDRYNLLLILPVAVAAGYAVADLRGRFEGRLRSVVPLALGALILFEYLSVPIEMRPLPIPPFYETLAEEPGEFGIIELPIDLHFSDKHYMLYQTVHDLPLASGCISRRPAGATSFLETNSFLSQPYGTTEVDPSLTDVSRQLASLQEAGFRYIILHKHWFSGGQVDRWRRYLPIRPRYEDGELIAYATGPQSGTDFELAAELGPGIGLIQTITSTGCVNPGGVLEADAAWGTTTALDEVYAVEVALTSEGGAARHQEVFEVSSGWPTDEWPANTVAWGYYTLFVPPSLPLGEYSITLSLIEPEGQQERAVPVGRVQVQGSPCVFDIPEGMVALDSRFGDELRLPGYELRVEGTELMLDLYWRSEQRMETDYKIFVHVTDPGTGVPVAQDDSMPVRWSYRTTLWGPGESVLDRHRVRLEGVPSGTYDVALGVYDPATMERLRLVLAGEAQPEGILVLPGETVILP